MDQPANGWLLDRTWGWKGLGSVARNGEGGEMRTTSGMKDGGGRGGRRRGFLGAAGLLLLCITACQVHYYRERRTPEVRGVVLDAQSGRPVVGADVGVTVFGFPSNPLAGMASPPRWALAGEMLTTASDGTFILPSRCPSPTATGVSWLSYLLWGPMQKRSIGILVYAPEYIPLISEAHGFDWATDPWVAAASAGSGSVVKVTRTGSLKAGFQYRLHVKRAVTQEDWEKKCALTKQIASSQGEPYQTWLFNDLTGYLERWPQGEKAGEYLLILMDQIADGDSPTNIDYSLRAGELSRAAIPIILKRNRAILDLASRMNPPQEPHRVVVAFANYEQRIEAIRLCTSYLETISIKGGGK
ncbi:MAG: hypothetical protein WBS54_02555 [Acidobacteriota bacterium]